MQQNCIPQLLRKFRNYRHVNVNASNEFPIRIPLSVMALIISSNEIAYPYG
jgi:hypothetical protein